ncbi:MAG: hypothetical protein Roseis2KO_07580 [Roseivirga sp.]
MLEVRNTTYVLEAGSIGANPELSRFNLWLKQQGLSLLKKIFDSLCHFFNVSLGMCSAKQSGLGKICELR